MELHAIPIENPDGLNLILGQAHFIKTVEDLHEALADPRRPLPGERALVGRVMGTDDAQTLASWFSYFAEGVLVELERRSARPPLTQGTHRRRIGDRSAGATIGSSPCGGGR